MRILYLTRSASFRLDDDAADFALGLARMAQHAGNRVEVLVHCPMHAGAGVASMTHGGVTVGMMGAAGDQATEGAAEPVPEQVAAVAAWLRGRRFDLVHLLDAAMAPSVHEALRRSGLPLVLNTDAFEAPGLAPLAEALMRTAACRIAPDVDAAARCRAQWPALPCDVVAPGVDLLAIAAGRRLTPADGPLCAGWSGDAWPSLARVLDTLGLPGRQVEGNPADRQAALHRVDLLCLPPAAPRRRLFAAQAAGVPALVAPGNAAADAVRRSGAGAVAGQDDAAAWGDVLAAWAADAALRAQWRQAVRPPPRIEETAFLYESLYRRAVPGL